MKVAIQGLGEVPKTIEIVLRDEKPSRTYIICSEYQANLVASKSGYTKSNEEVIKEAAKKTGTEVIFYKCDVFDPRSIYEAIKKVLQQVDIKKDEIIVNYTGGSAVVRLLLGTISIMLSRFARVRILYAIDYPKDVKVDADQTEALKEVIPTDLQLILDFLEKGPKSEFKTSRKKKVDFPEEHVG